MNLDEFLDSVRRGQRHQPGGHLGDAAARVRDNRDAGVAALTPRRLEVLELMAQAASFADHLAGSVAPRRTPPRC